MSKPKSPGYICKLRWLEDRFNEGLQILLLGDGGRGFIEYIPGEFAWRALDAEGYMYIHCLWVVGQSKKHGHGSLLLEACIDEARQSGMNGVAIAVSKGNWLVGPMLFRKHGFQPVDAAEPSFELLALRFRDAPPPRFRTSLDTRASRYPNGLTVFRSDQCPYLDDAVNAVHEVANALGLPYREIEMNSARKVRELSPHVYGVFSIVYRGRLLSHHYLLKKDVLKRIEKMDHALV